MINLICQSGPFGDETSNYDVKTNAKTVGEFIDMVLSERNSEWGEVCIRREDSYFDGSICVCNYSNGKVNRKAKNLDAYRNAKIKNIFANGGWSCMRYDITVEDYESLPEQDRREFQYVYFGWQRKQRIHTTRTTEN